MSSGELTIKPYTGALGCEISGVDLSKPLEDRTFREIHEAFLRYSVIFFHDQKLDQGQLAAFGRRFGELEKEPFIPNEGEEPGVYLMKGAGGDILTTQNLGWHVDHSYQKNPSLGAVLYAVDIPAAGGDTLFANMMLAYESLSPAIKEFISKLTGIHDVLHYGIASGHMSIKSQKSLSRLAAERERYPQIFHPLVCTHPENGRKILYINQAWTSGIKELRPQESKHLLAMLNEHALQEKFKCRFRWSNGSIAMWDNRCVQHCPTSDYSTARHMLRVAIHTNWEPH
jgi:taurine dioxygenase